MQGLAQLRDGDLFVDCGAWIGATSLPAAARGARVVAFEPDPVARAEFLSNVQLSGMADRITVHPFALTDRAATMNMTSPYVLGDSMTRLTPRTEGDRSTQVEVVDVRSVLADFEGARLIKIDIEGGEYAVLRAMRPWLRRHHPDLMLSLHTYQFNPRLEQWPRIARIVARRAIAAGLKVRLAWLLRIYPDRFGPTPTGWAPIRALDLVRTIATPGESEIYLSARS